MKKREVRLIALLVALVVVLPALTLTGVFYMAEQQNWSGDVCEWRSWGHCFGR